jgi:hypothetical protein
VDYLNPTRIELILMSQIPYKILFKKQGISMNNSRVRQNPMKTGRRKKIQDSRRRGFNP